MKQSPDLEPIDKLRARPAADEPGRVRPSGSSDIRAAHPYALGRRSLRSAARRLSSVASLLVLDAAGLALGVYLTLAVRELWVGNTPILWGAIWQAFVTVFPFLVLVTVLVFWQQGLYSQRESRAGSVWSSSMTVAPGR